MTVPHRTNRLVIGLIGLAAVAVAVYGLVRSFNGFGDSRAQQALITPDLVAWLDRNENWVWPLVAIAGLLVFLIGLRWLLAQLHTRPPAVDWNVDQPSGTTTVAGDGVASAVRADLLGIPAIDDAAARLTGDETDPRLDLRLTLHDDADTGQILDRVESNVVSRLCAALERDTIAATVLIDLAPGHRRIN